MARLYSTRQILSQYGANVMALIIAALLLATAAPRTLATLFSLSSPAAIFDIEHGLKVSEQRLAETEDDLRAALTYGVETATFHSQLSMLSLSRLVGQPPSPARRTALEAAREAAGSALRMRPLDAYLWTRYAHISYLLDGLSIQTVVALEKSFLYGRHEPQLVRFRNTLCLREWDRLPQALKDQARKQPGFPGTDVPAFPQS